MDDIQINMWGQDGAIPAGISGVQQQAQSAPMNEILRRNLAAMRIKSPLAATLIGQSRASEDACFVKTDEGIESVVLSGVALASKRKPMAEAKRFAQGFDPTDTACCAVVGFGAGYHCGALLERLGSVGVILCYEPDVELLRSVLERVDYSEMFETGRFFLVTDERDATTLNQMFSGIEAVIGLGVEVIYHPHSTQRIGSRGGCFGQVFCDVIKAIRTHVITTLANSQVTFRNALMNLDHYTANKGIGLLQDSCKGKVAIVVSAGPSLEKNLSLLADPKVRDSVVVIAVQTVLKVMLERGIKPHFVAALDYHEISKRFYEGLNAEDVEGIRLIVEPKANPAILDAFPGEVLCVGDEMLNSVLGEELTNNTSRLRLGGTVAHLCYYFARHLGCDPVIFIGQDLGFTDGQYYSNGAAIHQVWSGELNAHNTLEMMEWQRIVRMKGLLRKKVDIHGREIYLDEQMATYLAQFESDFQKDAEGGLSVIDATEGGVRKENTSVMMLQRALDLHASKDPVVIPSTADSGAGRADRTQRVKRRISEIIDDCSRIVYLSEQTIGILGEMAKIKGDQRRVNSMIEQVQEIGQRVIKMEAAFRMTETVNQIGVLNRMKRDRMIHIDPDADVFDRQRLQIERDTVNVQWTRDAADSVVKQLTIARDVLDGTASKMTNDLDVLIENNAHQDDEVRTRDCVHAMVIADPQFGGLGNKRDLGEVIAHSMNALQLTLTRLDRVEQFDGITVLTPDPDAVRGLIGSIPLKTSVEIVGVDPVQMRERAARIGSARVQSSECWRGSVGMLSVYDEQFDPRLIAKVMGQKGIDGCAIVGADWAMINPSIVDQTVSRFRNQEQGKRIAFSQAVPGIGTMVVDRATVESLAGSLSRQSDGGKHFSTMGALVGYIPSAPQFDPIAKGVCVEIDPAIRDAGVRVIADTRVRVETMRQAFRSLCPDGVVDAAQCVGMFAEKLKRESRTCPRTIVLETCTGRLSGGDWSAWRRNSIEPIERKVVSMNQVHSLLGSFGALREDGAIVFDGVGDPLMHPDAMGFTQLAKEDGVSCVELRTDFLHGGVGSGELLESGIDVLSVDLLAEDARVYASLVGQDRLDEVYARVQSVFDVMRADRERSLWFVPRLTRCDAVYSDVEQFVDKWLMICGSAVIDSLPRRIDGQRIQRLPIPNHRQRQMDLNTMYIQCDGMVVDRLGQSIRSINVFDDGIELAYQRACAALRSSQIEPKSDGVLQTQESAA